MDVLQGQCSCVFSHNSTLLKLKIEHALAVAFRGLTDVYIITKMEGFKPSTVKTCYLTGLKRHWYIVVFRLLKKGNACLQMRKSHDLRGIPKTFQRYDHGLDLMLRQAG